MAYLDHAATTPIRPEARAAWLAAPEGNPSSVHSVGRTARAALESARERIAEHLGVHPLDVVLTCGGTLADNLAVRGIHAARVAEDAGRDTIAISAIEHPAVREAAQEAVVGTPNGRVLQMPVDSEGRLDLGAAAEVVAENRTRISVMSVMSANNEVGTVQPVAAVAELAARWGIPVHIDAVQSVGWWGLPDAPDAAVSVSGHKFGAPVGTGALVLPENRTCRALIRGGGQERGVHSGTLDVRGAAAFAAALVAAGTSGEASGDPHTPLPKLRDELAQLLIAAGAKVVTPPTGALPGIVGAVFAGCRSESMLLMLDAAGIECSAGSACSAGVARPSRVVRAMGFDERDALAFLRFSLGWTSTRAELAELAAALPAAVERSRAAVARAGEAW